MMAEMTAAEVAGWQAYYSVEPWGEWPQERRMAITATLIANANGAKCRPDDFVPKVWKPPEESWQSMKSKLLRSRGISEK